MSIDKTLEKIFNDGTVSFSTVKNQIVLKKNTKRAPINKNVTRNIAAQKAIVISVRGTITDNQGSSIPNVSVVEKGTDNGVASDNEGNYSIVVSDPNSVLVFSSVGYSQQRSEEHTSELQSLMRISY